MPIGPPQPGNIIGSVLSGDVFTRYCRLRDYHCFHVAGTDEYGTATETKALELNKTPQEVCDEYHKIHASIYQWFNIDFDQFGRTTTELQTKLAQEMFLKLEANGYLFKDIIEQLYCEKCCRFLADRFVEGTCPFCLFDDARGDQCDKCGKLINVMEIKEPKCKLCKTQPTIKQSEHFFFDLPKLKDKLRVWFKEVVDKSAPPPKLIRSTNIDGNEKHLNDAKDSEFSSVHNNHAGESNKTVYSNLNEEHFHWTHVAKSITESWLKDDLKPRCITRDLKWGTKVPCKGFEDKVFYVWFDAPIGYLSISAAHSSEWHKWWKGDLAHDNVELFHFMAKDNVPFHSIMFKAALIASGDLWVRRQNVIAVDYLNYENTKFSKSRGVGVFGNDAQETGIPADLWRFYLLYIRPEGMDSSFSWDDFKEKVNSELLNNLGNFINRALSFIEKNFDSCLSSCNVNEDDKNYLREVESNLFTYFENMERVHLRDGLKIILAVSKVGNQLIQANKPWVLVKGNDEEKKRAETVMYLALNTVALIALMISPFMPEVGKTIKKQILYDGEHLTGADFDLKSELNLVGYFRFLIPLGHKIGTPSPLFKRIEQDQIIELKKRFGPTVIDSKADKKNKNKNKTKNKPAENQSVPNKP